MKANEAQEQYIPKAVVVAEIERRMELNNTCQKISGGHEFYRGAIDEAKEILSFLDTLEVKEVDLEKEIDNYISSNFFGSETLGFFANRTKEEPNDIDMALCAKHFFELGLLSQLSWKDIELIAEIGMDFMSSEDSDNLNDEEYYTEILNRFKAQKGEKV